MNITHKKADYKTPLTNHDVCDLLEVSPQHVRNTTKKAADQGLSIISLKDERFTFTKVAGIGGRGWTYQYERIAPQTAAKPRRKVKPVKSINPAHLPNIDDLSKFTTDEKVNLIGFYNTSKYPLGLIVKTLITAHASDTKPASLQTKVKRWLKTYKEKGRAGLEDKRGGKAFKADLELVRQAIYGGGSRHIKTLFGFYCYLYAQQNGLPINVKKPTSNISESAFSRAVKHLTDTDNAIYEYMRLGQDAFRYAMPSMGNNWLYPNQQWEVDATPVDIIVKVPLNKDGVKDFSLRDINSDFEMVDLSKKNSRVTLTRLIDNYSKATVHMVVESSNSYANARLLYIKPPGLVIFGGFLALF